MFCILTFSKIVQVKHAASINGNIRLCRRENNAVFCPVIKLF